MNENRSFALLRRFLAGLGAATVGGFVAGCLEGWLSSPRGIAWKAGPLAGGLVAPLGLAVGAATLILLMAAGAGEPSAFWRLFCRRLRTDPSWSRGVLARSLLLSGAFLAFLTFAYNTGRGALSRFHHMGLAALLISSALAGFAAISLLVARRLERPLARALAHLPAGTVRRLIPIGFAAAPIALFLAVLLLPAERSGSLGLMGLLKRDELELAFSAWLLIPAIAAVIVFAATEKRRLGHARFALLAATGIAAGAFFTAAFHFRGDMAAAAVVERNTGLARRALTGARCLFDRDRDRASSLFGGNDCDDNDPARLPGALDVPGNGIDEDCDGEDSPSGSIRPGHNKGRPGARTDLGGI